MAGKAMETGLVISEHAESDGLLKPVGHLVNDFMVRPMSERQSCWKNGRKLRVRCDCTLEAGGGKGQKGYAGFHGPGCD